MSDVITQQSSTPSQRKERSLNASRLLARLISRQLQVDVPEEELRTFVLCNWAKLAKLAHTIHGSEDEEDTRTY